ncbi:HNH endonuclease [Peptoniphilus sp. MSJ-1]|uniref:HNH endonuclease n=1 Tax=Peptoniphilus ovalis TaxID=2841503 RepID=A0ABS6FHD1_9FIRM|nr:HNH endonuclease [Peptoniphilus ovalis]MBU5669578.1 HNH endonuclease [Peptoniphilus ovalis]
MYIILFLLFTFAVYCLLVAIEYFYFKSEKFILLKGRISTFVQECNELNEHIDNLKDFSNIYNKNDYGNALIEDESIYKFKRDSLHDYSNSDLTYNCSLNICRAARNKPFDYLCKYFNISKDEESLGCFENMLNDFMAIEEGKSILIEKKNIILDSIRNSIPKYILFFSLEKLVYELGFEEIDFSDLYIPKYCFHYISAGGNSSLKTIIELNPGTLDSFINYLDTHIKWRKSIKGQRALMTSKLREQIKKRDDYTCCKCGNSIYLEPNLLLEIDHIIPLSKGGTSEISNLQTLCWRCNRSKGSKIE